MEEREREREISAKMIRKKAREWEREGEEKKQKKRGRTVVSLLGKKNLRVPQGLLFPYGQEGISHQAQEMQCLMQTKQDRVIILLRNSFPLSHFPHTKRGLE